MKNKLLKDIKNFIKDTYLSGTFKMSDTINNVDALFTRINDKYRDLIFMTDLNYKFHTNPESTWNKYMEICTRLNHVDTDLDCIVIRIHDNWDHANIDITITSFNNLIAYYDYFMDKIKFMEFINN